MKKFLLKNSWWITFILTFVLLIVYSLSLFNIKVDNISIVLLVILLISPFASNLKKIKFGDFEAEIDSKEVNKIKQEINNKIREDSELNEGKSHSIEFQDTINNIKDMFENDIILALAKLRIELEKTTNKLYKAAVDDGINKKHLTLSKLVRELTLKEILPKHIESPLREVIYLCNRAIHGEEVSKKDALAIGDMGISLIKFIYNISQDYAVEPVEVIPITHEILNYYNKAKYKVVTLIPYVDGPVKNIRYLTQEGLNNFLDGYEEYAEFIIEISGVDDSLNSV